MRSICACMWLLVALSASVIMAVGAPLRVALAEFSVDDNSYRSAAAASDFTAALQARIAGEVPVEWIERQQLGPAEREIELSLMANEANVLRRGQWLKAEIMLTGAFITNNAGRTLHIEAVDVDRADVLAAKEVPLAISPKAPLNVINQLDRIATEVKAVLTAAMQRKQQMASRRSVAVLFLANQSTESGFDELERRLVTALEEESAKRNDFRVLRFQRANRARDEAELVLGGLVSDPTNAFHHIADLYVWGSVDRVARRGRFQHEVRLSVWNGDAAPIELLRTSTNAATELTAELSNAVISALTNNAPANRTEEIRARLSRELWQQAYAITERNPSVYAGTVEGRTRLFSLLKILETACFLDPGNREAQADRIVYRWGSPSHPIARDRNVRSYWRYSDAWGAHVDRFGFELRKTNAAGAVKVVDLAEYYFRSTWFLAELVRLGNRTDFGFPLDVPTRVANLWVEDIHNELVRRAIKVADRKELAVWVAQTISAVLEEPGAPVALRDRAAQKQLIAGAWPHLVRHHGAGTQVNFPAFVRPAINKLYADEGKSNEGDRLFALLKTSQPPVTAAPATAPPKTASESTQDELIMEQPRWEWAIPVLTGGVESVPFPKDIVVQKVTSLAYGNGKLWIISDGMRQVAVETSNELEREFGVLKAESVEFWSYDPASRLMIPLRHVLPTNSNPLSVKAGGTNIWLGASDGLYRMTAAASAERVGGTNLAPVFGLAVGRSHLLAARNSRDGGILTLSSGTWTNYSIPTRVTIAGQPVSVTSRGNQALLAVQQLTILDFPNGPAMFVTNLLHGGAPRPVERGAPVDADESGFWVGGGSGLHFVDPSGKPSSRWLPAQVTVANPLYSDRSERSHTSPTSPGLPSHFGEWRALRERVAKSQSGGERFRPLQPATKLPGPVTTLASDGDFLWLVSAAQSDFWLMLLHKPSARWVGQMKLPVYRGYGVPAIAVSAEAVWLGLTQSRYQGELAPLLRISKQTFSSVPQEKWAKDQITTEELAQIEGWKDGEQATYHLFSGDSQRVVALLGKLDPKEMSLQNLYLMGCAYDHLGLDQPQLARRYFEEILSREPDSPWGAEARDTLAGLEARVAEAKREREYLARYDKNRDGRIDDAEGDQMRRDPQYIKEEEERTSAQKLKADFEADEQVRGFLGHHDRNRNGRLDRVEFMTGQRNAYGAVTGPLFDPILFDMCDTNRNQELDPVEIRKLLKDVASPGPRPMRPGPPRSPRP